MSKLINKSTEHKKDKGVEKLWDFYSKKFGLDKSVNEKKLIIFSLNFVNDFLSGNLWCPQCLLINLVTKERIKYNKFIAKKNSKLDLLLFEILDIAWMKETMSKQKYEEYLNELRERLEELVKYYEEYLSILIKSKYKTINFPIKTEPPYIGRKVFRIYLKEFDFKKRLFFKKYVSIALSAIHDYFQNKLTNEQMQELSWQLTTNPLTRKYMRKSFLKKHNKLLAFVSKFGDLVWNSEGKYFSETINELKKEWEELVEVYEIYFTKDKNILDKKNYPATLETFTLRYGKKPLIKTKSLEKYFK